MPMTTEYVVGKAINEFDKRITDAYSVLQNDFHAREKWLNVPVYKYFKDSDVGMNEEAQKQLKKFFKDWGYDFKFDPEYNAYCVYIQD